MRITTARPFALAAGLAAAMALLVWALPSDPAAAFADSRGPGARAEAQLAVIAGGLAWLLVAWLTCSAVLTVVARVPGALGGLAGSIAAKVTPTLVRRSVEAALGATLAGASLVPAAAFAAPGERPAGVERSVATSDVRAALTPALTPAASDNAVTPYDRPASPLPQRDVANTKRAASIAVISPAARGEHDQAVVVRRGDTLWSIAARALGDDARDAEVDSEWRRWFAANRQIIGSDPNLITPGMRLIAPTD